MAVERGVRRGWQSPTFVGIVAFAFLVTYATFVATGPITHGFIAYYAASRLLVAGQFGPHVYAMDGFSSTSGT